MEKARAIDLLQCQLQALARLDRMSPFGAEFHKWRRDTEVVIREIFGQPSPHLTEFDKISYEVHAGILSDETIRHAFSSGLSRARAMLESMVRELTDFWSDSPAPLTSGPIPLDRRLHICRRFPLVARQLRHRYNDRTAYQIADEHDVQDLFHALLAIDFDDIRSEEWSPSYAGGASRLDFLLKRERLVIELKKSRSSLGSREIGEQLTIDIARYQAHPDCAALVCFVYDPDALVTNPRGLEGDLSREHGTLPVSVVVAP